MEGSSFITRSSRSALQPTPAVPVNEIFAARIGDANSAALFTSARFGGDGREPRFMEIAVIVPIDQSVVSGLPISVHGHGENDDQE